MVGRPKDLQTAGGGVVVHYSPGPYYKKPVRGDPYTYQWASSPKTLEKEVQGGRSYMGPCGLEWFGAGLPRIHQDSPMLGCEVHVCFLPWAEHDAMAVPLGIELPAMWPPGR